MATTTVLSSTEDPSLTKVITTTTTTALPAPTSSPTFSWHHGPIPLITTPLSLLPANTPADQYTLAATEMALVHNCLIRALNSIYVQSPHVPAHEVTNFLHFCQATYEGLKAHHRGEEEMFFPEVQRITGEEDVMDENVRGHEAFEAGFGAWGAWIAGCLSEKTGTSTSSSVTTGVASNKNKNKEQHPPPSFSSTTNIQLMDIFLPPLSTHLHAEIPSLLALRRFGSTLDLARMFKAEGDAVMGAMCKTTVVPIFLHNHDEQFEGGIHCFPPLPGVVKWVLRNAFGRVNGAWWKFAACGFDGVAREVRFCGV